MSGFWRLLLDCGVPMSGAFPPGRGSALTPDERRQIQCLALVDGETVSAIARTTGRDRETVANVLRADDTRALREQLATEAADAAKLVLRSSAERVARKWVSAVDAAAEKGDHRPARDLLLHTRVIEPIDKGGPHVGIQVIVGSPDQPAGPDPFDALEARQVVNVTPLRREDGQ